MTKKPKPEIQAVLDEWFRENQDSVIKSGWVIIQGKEELFNPYKEAIEALATLAHTRGLEQGKLIGKTEGKLEQLKE